MEEVDLNHVGSNTDDDRLAVKITNGYKAYSSTAVVLNGFNMNVGKGTM